MNRKQQRQLWLSEYFKQHTFEMTTASADASFRSYYRVTTPSGSYILMDAPPTHEDCRPFIKTLKILQQKQVHVPSLFAADLEQGFLLLSDFGSTLYLDVLNEETVDTYYLPAIDVIVSMQNIDAAHDLPLYDASLLMDEMQLFSDWFVQEHLGFSLSAEQTALLKNTYEKLLANALDQPQVMVHRDFHSRNLMVTAENHPGVIDFQDAVWGPFTYDLASLLKDCYINWPETTIERLCQYFLKIHNTTSRQQITYQTFKRWFDLMAAQRHLKAIGIFCRLNYRDGKPGYLHDIPRTMKYLLKTSQAYPDLASFGQLLQELQPKLVKHG